MIQSIVLSALLVFVARVLNVTISTLRTLMMTRGRKLLAAFLGFFEALLFALIISQVVQNLDNVWNLVGYSAGFSVGILLGLEIEGWLAVGYATVNVVSSFKAHDVAEAIRQAGFGATESRGFGSESEVGLVRAVVPRREIEAVSKIVSEVDPASFVTIEDTAAVRRGHLGILRMRG